MRIEYRGAGRQVLQIAISQLCRDHDFIERLLIRARGRRRGRHGDKQTRNRGERA
jgi:hypothetical protein